MTSPPPTDAVMELLRDGLELDAPDTIGPLTVFPILAPRGAVEYRSFAEAAAHGFTITELEPASVNDVLATNPLDTPVLLFEGEEVVGAQQDRTVDVSVLVDAHAKVVVHVSCVEQRRWQSSRHAEPFTPSQRSAFPELRATKSRRMRAAMAAGLEARADQGEVWDAVASKSERLRARSDTGAMGGVFDAGRTDELEAAIRRRDGQVGALACIGGRPAVVDLVSRAEVFAALFTPLVRGYCLDALEAPDGTAAADPEPFLAALCTATLRRRPAVGLGETLAVEGRGVGGTGLALGDELIQLSVFAEERVEHRVLRPSRRR